MWIKATQEKFEEYGQSIDTERQLNDGKCIKHMELVGKTTEEIENFFKNIRLDLEVTILTNQEMDELLMLEG